MTESELDAIDTRRRLARDEVVAICKGKQWRMCIPVEQTDSDICIVSALDDNGALVAEVRRLSDIMERGAEYTAGLKTEAEMLLRERNDAEAEIVKLRAELERFTLTEDEDDTIENLIIRLRRTMVDGELYGVDEQEAQMRYMLRSAFAPLMDEVRQLRSDIERIGRERDDMIRANVELQERLSVATLRLEKMLPAEVRPPAGEHIHG